jgi:hypothetical protein
MNATPALARGLSGSSDTIILRFFWYLSCRVLVIFSSRCVSCMARIAIFSDWIVSLILFHLFRNVMFSDGAAAPFRFWDAILIFALRLVLLFRVCMKVAPRLAGGSPGVGCAVLGWELSLGVVVPCGGPVGCDGPSGCVGMCSLSGSVLLMGKSGAYFGVWDKF